MWSSSLSSPWFGQGNFLMLEMEFPFIMGDLLYDGQACTCSRVKLPDKVTRGGPGMKTDQQASRKQKLGKPRMTTTQNLTEISLLVPEKRLISSQFHASFSSLGPFCGNAHLQSWMGHMYHKKNHALVPFNSFQVPPLLPKSWNSGINLANSFLSGPNLSPSFSFLVQKMCFGTSSETRPKRQGRGGTFGVTMNPPIFLD